MQDDKAQMEKPHRKIILWQDHTHDEGYRPQLRLLLFEDGEKAIEFEWFGRVVSYSYFSGHEEEMAELRRQLGERDKQ